MRSTGPLFFIWLQGSNLRREKAQKSIYMNQISGDSATRFSTSGFLRGSVSPKPLIIQVSLGPFRIFFQNAEIFAASLRTWDRWQNCHRYQQPSGTGGKVCRWCRWYRCGTLTCEYLREFSKKFEMALVLFSGAWGRMIHAKNLNQKISWHCPCKGTVTPD